MKKFLALLLSLALVLCIFAACGKSSEEEPVTTTKAAAQNTGEPESESVSQNTTVENYTLGKLVAVKDDTDFVLKGLRLNGNRSYANNDKDYATEDIRSGFYIQERIEFFLDTTYSNPDSEDVKVVCLPHRDFAEYEKMSFDEIAEKAAFVEIFTGMEDADSACFEPYVSSDFEPGDYDVLFTYKGEITYYIVINFTPEIESAE